MKYTHTYIRLVQKKLLSNYYSVSCYFKGEEVFQYVTEFPETDAYLEELIYSIKHKKLYLDNRINAVKFKSCTPFIRMEYSRLVNNPINSRFYWIFKKVIKL